MALDVATGHGNVTKIVQPEHFSEHLGYLWTENSVRKKINKIKVL